jgi:drug/metabolite transporter (DMT)-like permease
MTVPAPSTPNIKGIVAMCAAMALFTVNDVLVKLVATQLAPHQILLVRGAFASLFALSLVFAAQEQRQLSMLAQPLVLARCCVEGLVAFTFISALAVLPIADITAILLLSPLIITIIAALFFKEDVRWRRWMAVIAGFIGMLFVVKPGSDGVQTASLLAFVSTLLVAARDLMTRRLPATVPSRVVAAGTTITTTILGGMLALFQPWVALDGHTLLLLIGAATVVTLGNFAIIVAFRDVDVSVVSPYRYTLIVWAVLAGAVVFGDVPTGVSWIGIALIIGSGLYTLYRETTVRSGLKDHPSV